MYLSGSACERAVVLSGAGSPAYVTTATSPRRASLEDLLGFYGDQVLTFDAWRQASTSLTDQLLNQIATDIRFSSDIGVGLWFFGRTPFLDRLRRVTAEINTPDKFAEAALQSIVLGRVLPVSASLPGQLNAMAAQLARRAETLSPTQWRAWMDISLSFSFPLTEPALAAWNDLVTYQIAVPGSPDLNSIGFKTLISLAPQIVLLPNSAAGLYASYQIMQGQYTAAWTAALTGAGISIVLVGTRSLLGFLIERVAPDKSDATTNSTADTVQPSHRRKRPGGKRNKKL
jgi:hypothetical protein